MAPWAPAPELAVALKLLSSRVIAHTIALEALGSV